MSTQRFQCLIWRRSSRLLSVCSCWFCWLCRTGLGVTRCTFFAPLSFFSSPFLCTSTRSHLPRRKNKPHRFVRAKALRVTPVALQRLFTEHSQRWSQPRARCSLCRLSYFIIHLANLPRKKTRHFLLEPRYKSFCVLRCEVTYYSYFPAYYYFDSPLNSTVLFWLSLKNTAEFSQSGFGREFMRLCSMFTQSLGVVLCKSSRNSHLREDNWWQCLDPDDRSCDCVLI